MDVNKVYLSGVVDKVYQNSSQATTGVLTSFYLKTAIGDAILSPMYDYHQIYMNKECILDHAPLCHLTVGKKVNIKGAIKNFVYTDPLGHRVTISKVVASHISILEE